MRWGGVIIALFIVYHILDLTFGVVNPDGHGLDAVRPAGRELPEPDRHDVLRGHPAPARHAPAPRPLERDADARPEQPAPGARPSTPAPPGSPSSSSPATSWCRPPSSSGSWTKEQERLLMPLELFTVGEPDRRHQGPDGRADRGALEHPTLPRPPGQPGQPPQDDGHRRRHRPGRRLGRRDARRGRLQGQVVLVPGQPAPRAQRRRAGWHQRREELPQRRRQRAPAVLRHGQGRRLPLPREQRAPPRRGQRQHHRPVRRPGRALRPRVRRPARQPLLRWHPGLADLLRPRPDGPAAALRRLPGARAADRGRQRRAARPHRDARPDRRRRPGPRHRRARPGHRRDQHPLRRRRRPGHGRLRQRLLPVDQRQGLQRHGDLAGAQARAPTSPTPATRRSTRPASRSRATTSRSSR